jgi:hypothetical protein
MQGIRAVIAPMDQTKPPTVVVMGVRTITTAVRGEGLGTQIRPRSA